MVVGVLAAILHGATLPVTVTILVVVSYGGLSGLAVDGCRRTGSHIARCYIASYCDDLY